jgi:hypothetical protein
MASKVTLRDSSSIKNAYQILENFQGPPFRRGYVVASDEVSGCSVIYWHGNSGVNSNGKCHVNIMDTVFYSHDVQGRLYDHAKKFAEDLAKENNAEFNDRTKRKRDLEKAVSSPIV